MDSGELSESDNLDRLNELLAGLGGALGDGGLMGWASSGDLAAVPGQVFEAVRDAGLLEDADPRSRRTNPAKPARRQPVPVSIPADADALMSLMWEIDEPEAIGLLDGLTASAAPNRPRHHHLRRISVPAPQDIFEEMAGLIGPDTRWWTNTDLTRWNPITQHTFDAVVVAAGNGIIVTLIAIEGGG